MFSKRISFHLIQLDNRVIRDCLLPIQVQLNVLALYIRFFVLHIFFELSDRIRDQRVFRRNHPLDEFDFLGINIIDVIRPNQLCE